MTTLAVWKCSRGVSPTAGRSCRRRRRMCGRRARRGSCGPRRSRQLWETVPAVCRVLRRRTRRPPGRVPSTPRRPAPVRGEAEAVGRARAVRGGGPHGRFPGRVQADPVAEPLRRRVDDRARVGDRAGQLAWVLETAARSKVSLPRVARYHRAREGGEETSFAWAMRTLRRSRPGPRFAAGAPPGGRRSRSATGSRRRSRRSADPQAARCAAERAPGSRSCRRRRWSRRQRGPRSRRRDSRSTSRARARPATGAPPLVTLPLTVKVAPMGQLGGRRGRGEHRGRRASAARLERPAERGQAARAQCDGGGTGEHAAAGRSAEGRGDAPQASA